MLEIWSQMGRKKPTYNQKAADIFGQAQVRFHVANQTEIAVQQKDMLKKVKNNNCSSSKVCFIQDKLNISYFQTIVT